MSKTLRLFYKIFFCLQNISTLKKISLFPLLRAEITGGAIMPPPPGPVDPLRVEVIVTVKALGPWSAILFFIFILPPLLQLIKFKSLNRSRVCLFRSQVCTYKLKFLGLYSKFQCIFIHLETLCEQFKTLKFY